MSSNNFITTDDKLFTTVDGSIFNIVSDTDNITNNNEKSLILYSNTASSITLNKFDSLTLVLETDYYIKESSSIVDPVLTINYSGYIKANYAYIKEFNRYYFITDIISVSQNIWELYLHTDVLMSFYNTTISQFALVTRNQYEYDLTLKDGTLPLSYIPKKSYIHSETGCPLGWARVSNNFNSDDCAPNILVFCSSPRSEQIYFNDVDVTTDLEHISPLRFNGMAGGITIYALNPRELSYLRKDLYTPQTYNDINSWVEEPSDGIVKAISLPFHIPAEWLIGGREIIEVGNVTMPNSTGIRMSEQMIYSLTVGRITIPKDRENVFLNTGDYSRYELYLPCLGFVDLDPHLMYISDKITINYSFDFINSSTTAYIINESNMLLHQQTFRLGVDIPLTTTRASEAGRNALLAGANMIASTVTGGVSGLLVGGSVGSAIGGVSGLTNPNYNIRRKHQIRRANLSDSFSIAGIPLGGLGGLTKGMTRVIHDSQRQFNHGVSQGDSSSWYGPLKPYLCYTRPESLADYNYNVNCGRPLMKYKQLYSVHGYTECSDFHLTGYDNALPNELEELEAILTNGVILP